MVQRLRESRVAYILLSVLLALLIWAYVRGVDDSAQRWTVYNVPVQLVGDRALEERGLTIASLSHNEVDVVIQAPFSVRNSLNRTNVTVSLDVSACTAPGEYELTWSAKLPTNINTSGTYFPEQDQTITVVVDNLVTESREVELQLEGSVADGYRAGTPVIEPGTVEVKGTLAQVAKVKRVVAVLTADDLKESFAGTLTLSMLDEDGEVIDDPRVTLSSSTAFVTLSVGVVKEIPLTVTFTDGGGATADDVLDCSIEPSTITVAGSKEEIDALGEISLGSIDLSTIIGTTQKTMPVNLSPTLENVKGLNEVTVTVTVRDLPTRTFNVSNIQMINIPSGYDAELMTQERLVVVRGDEEELNGLDASKLRIVADLSNVTATGISSVRVNVYLDASSKVGVVGEYTVNVSISK